MALFSDNNSDSGEKTEAPTAKRASDARNKGQVGLSQELSHVIGMIAAFNICRKVLPWLWQDMQNILRGALSSELATQVFTVELLKTNFYALLLTLLPKLFLLFFVAAVFGAGCTLLQTNFLWSWELIKFKGYKINPIDGIKRLFSLPSLMNFGLQLLKLCILGPVAYFTFIDFVPSLLRMSDVPISDLLPLTADYMGSIFASFMKWLLVLAILDMIWKRWRNSKRLKMSKQEVKDERKSSEGDESTKKRILAIGLERARERMFLAVAKADVVVTNPTHLSVALSYSTEEGGAPRVVAKGQGHVAMRIREIAKAHKVPVIERKPLARALYASVDVGQEIPYELFRAVAELLAYVYRIKGKRPAIRKAANANNTHSNTGQRNS